MDKKKNTTYLKFDKSRMVNLEYSLAREVLRTNRKGAYLSTTLVECNTRKQHGLLAIPIPELGDSDHLLLSSLDETIIQHGAEFNLGIHKYDGDNYNPMGHKYIREFSCDRLPHTIYRVGGVILSKEKMFSLVTNTVFIRYTLIDAHSPTTIRFKPFLAFRDVNQLTFENTTADHGYKEIENGASLCMYSKYPTLHMQFNKEPKFTFNPHWNKGIEYKQDMLDGVPYKEDLYVPGYFEMSIKKGESIIFSASDRPARVNDLAQAFEGGILNRTPRSSFFNCLKNSGHQFYFRPNDNELYILSGYPWGRVRAREQFIALSSLTIGIDREEAFEEAMDTAIPALEQLLHGEKPTGYLHELDNADVILYAIKSLKSFADVNRTRFYEKYASLVSRLVEFILNGKHPNLKIIENGLLSVDSYTGNPSWMHHIRGVAHEHIPRTGLLVEVNAMWYNSLKFNEEIARNDKNKKLEKQMTILGEKVKRSFLDTFLNEGGYLYDYVDGNFVDWSVRPNMLFAIASDYSLLDKRQSKFILDIITKELLTTKGIRTLSPKSIGFRPRVEGTIKEKAYSAYNGAAWPWLIDLYIEAYYKIFQRSGLSFISKLLIGLEDEMSNDCIGSLSSLYDGSAPYVGHGLPSYATSVAGILKAIKIQKSYEDNY